MSAMALVPRPARHGSCVQASRCDITQVSSSWLHLARADAYRHPTSLTPAEVPGAHGNNPPLCGTQGQGLTAQAPGWAGDVKECYLP